MIRLLTEQNQLLHKQLQKSRSPSPQPRTTDYPTSPRGTSLVAQPTPLDKQLCVGSLQPTPGYDSSIQLSKPKEADKIELTNFPKQGESFLQFRDTTRDRVTYASPCPNLAFRWINIVDKDT